MGIIALPEFMVLHKKNILLRGMYADWEELVAGNPQYAFNEYIQVALEGGIPFLIGVLSLLAYCFYSGWTKKRIGNYLIGLLRFR